MGDFANARQDSSGSLVAKVEDPATSVFARGTHDSNDVGGGSGGSGGSGNAERSPYSGGSTPEHDQDLDQDLEMDQGPGQDLDQTSGGVQQQKRKGGRKPIYATSEERKQRNRQAQAAFRERRTEYIKQLESTIKLHEETLHNLQASHRTAADECLMLRYKNSLLERILIEKGIDVQSELRAKTASPNFGPTRVPQPSPTAAPGAQPLGRFPISKFHPNRRSLSSINGKIDGVTQFQDTIMSNNRSPISQPNAASHISSPITSIARSPNFVAQGGQTSPSFGPLSQPLRPTQQQQSQPPQPIRTHFNPPARPAIVTQPQQSPQQRQTPQPPVSSALSNTSTGSTGSVITNNSTNGREAPSYFPSPFQNHYDQLEQEYDAQADMLDDQDPSDNSNGAVGPFPTSSFAPPPPIPAQGIPQSSLVPNPSTNQTSMAGQQEPIVNATFGNLPNNMFDPYDPMLDADPFGLSASMHFPTQFTFDAQR